MPAEIRIGDCFELIKKLPDNSIDLIITSPPYADIVNYGKNISIQKPQDYCDWLLPIFNEIQRVLKPSGSFILNINDTCKNGVRNPFIYELIYRSQKETKLKFYDTYIWWKRNGIPNGAPKRFRNTTEFIFHFVKDQKELKFHMDRVLQDFQQSTKNRYKYPVQKYQGIITDGIRERVSVEYQDNINPKVRPDNVFRFPTAASSKDNTIKHPAPFHKDLPKYYINLLTDDGDKILDIFGGIMTTGLACKEIGDRNFIGFELNEKYAEFGKNRIEGEELEQYRVVQYDLDGNYIADYKNRMEASKATGVQDGDIMRTYNRTKFNSRGGFIWKLEPEYVINQYDMNDTFIQSFNSPSQACKAVECNSFHHILTCYRGHSQSYMGYKWKLEKNNYAKK